ncbi:AAA family ATPase [Pantoea sp. 22096]|uniref:AAA family ATPase n=1 Tax=Pantoea sp. 22096 TaxID=3453873 RepID=UPI003F834B74
MKIKRIKLSDFRQFHNKNNIIEFSTDNDRNVTLIHAENGVGKTTILNSILWCFYEKFTPDFENKNNLVNIDSLIQGINECEVEVEFLHEGKTYSATRRYQEATRSSFLEVFFIDNGNYQPIRSDKQLLNSVIPEEMAEYFLFHGEGISQLQSKEISFRNAIRDVLGFNLANQAIEDMEVIKNNWQSKILKNNAEESKYNKALTELTSAESKLKENQVRQKKINEDLNFLSYDKKDIDEKILNCKVLDANEIKKEIFQSEKSKDRRNDDLLHQEKQKQRLIQIYGWRVFGFELSEDSLDFIDTKTLTGRIPAPYDETLVNDILSSSKCICGRSVKNGSLEYSVIVNLLDRANTYEIKANLMKARSFAQVIGKEARSFIEEFSVANKKINDLQHEISDLEGKITNLNAQLDRIDDTHLKSLRIREKDISFNISRLESTLNNLMREIENCNISVQQKKREAEKYMPNSGETFKIQERIYYIQKLIDFSNNKIKTTENDSKYRIANFVNEILEKFSRKAFKVKMSNDFNFEMVREDGGIVAKSKGEKLLLNLAFVSALIRLAAQRSNAQSKFLQPGTVAPFIIDAPFGELDEAYRKATSHFLPENSEQLVLLLSSSHWRGTVGDEIKNKVGKEYVLISHKKSTQGMKPLDEIIIDGNAINQSHYNCAFDGTSILEIK